MATATELENLVVRLTGDGSNYQNMLKGAQASSQAAASQIQAAAAKIQGLSTSVKGFASAALSAMAALGAMHTLKDFFGKFAEAEKGELKLRAALAANGRQVEETMASYQKFATEVESLTVLDDDAVLALLRKAESYKLTGEAAQAAVRNSIALAAVTDGEADSLIRVTAALQKGNVELAMHSARLVPQLRGIKDAAEFVAEAQRLMNAGWETAKAQATSASGRLQQLANAWENLKEEMGKVIATAIAPVVEKLKMLVEWMRTWTEDSKRMVVVALAVAAGLLLIGPALALLGLALGPVVALFGLVKAAILTLLSPVGLIVAAVVGLTYAWLRWTSSGGAAVEWFTEKWRDLVAEVEPAVRGIKAAVSAGDIALAFEIVWAQIQLTFAKATRSLREMWVGFVLIVKQLWIETANAIERSWQETTTWIAKRLTDIGKAVGIYSEEEAAQIQGILSEDLQRDLRRIEEERKKLLADAERDAGESMKAIEDRLKQLEAERNRLVAKAEEDAAKVLPKKLKMGVPEIPPIPDQNVKVVPKFDAAAFRSAEALSRLQEFRDLLEFRGKPGEAGKAAPARFDAAAAGGAEAMARKDESLQVLKDIRQVLKDDSKKPGVKLSPAGMA